MKLSKFAALVAIAVLMALQCIAHAQLPAPNPLVVPAPPPSPPAQLPAPVSTAIAPSPLAVPSLPAAYATPGARTFNCSCHGPGEPTHWMGTVTAASFISATQSASGACTGANTPRPSYGTAGGIGAGNFFGTLPGALQGAGAAKTFGFPGVAQSTGSSTSLGSLPGATQGVGVANSFGAPSAGLTLSAAQQARLCSACVCD